MPKRPRRRGAEIRHARLATFVALLVTACSAEAGRPLDTDDASIIPAGTCQLETFARRLRPDGDAPRSSEFGFAPSCNPYGWGEFLIAGGRAGVGATDPVSQGFVQIKGVPMSVTRDRIGWGYNASMEEDFVRGRGRPAARVSNLTALSSIAFATAWQVDGNLGWTHEWAPAARDRDHLTYGLAAEWSASTRLTFVGERTGIKSRGHVSQIGVTYIVTPRTTVDAAFGRRSSSESRALFATIGLTVVSVAP